MQYLKRVGLDLVKGAVAALASLLGLVAGGIITAMLGLPTPGMPPQMDLNTLMPLLFLTQIVITIVLGECFQQLYRRYWQRMLSIWLCAYLLYYLLNTLDGLLFSPLPNLSTSIVSSIFPALFAAAVIALLWRHKTTDLSFTGNAKAFFITMKPGTLAWRLLVAWLAFPPIYFMMGRVVAPFVQHYYEDPSLNLGLTLPPLGTMLAMQGLRGALFLLAVLPIMAAWRGSRRTLWLWTGFVIFIQIAGTLIFQAYWLPAGLRIPHALELLADSFLQAGVYVLLLFFPSKPMKESVTHQETVAIH
jgi:hypothetical protein